MNSATSIPALVHSAIPARRSVRWLADSPLRATLRLAAGLVFLVFGLEKQFWGIALGNALVQLPAGPHGFAMYLAAVGVPLPLLNAYLVLAVEIVLGPGLVAGAFVQMPRHLTRSFALVLMGDMAVATSAVGLRNVLHHPVLIHGLAVTDQLWRFPLEFGLLACMAYFTAKPASRSAPGLEPSAPASGTVVKAGRALRAPALGRAA